MNSADRVEILVIVDNVLDMLSSTPRFVQRETQMLRRFGMTRTAGECLCCASHGLSLLITAHGPAGARTMLFDGGPVDMSMARNAPRLGVDFAGIDAMMLSHGHGTMRAGCPRRSPCCGRASACRSTSTPACLPSVGCANPMAACCPWPPCQPPKAGQTWAPSLW